MRHPPCVILFSTLACGIVQLFARAAPFAPSQVAVITAGLILASQGRAAGDGISAALLHLMYIIPLTAPGALCALGKPRWLAYTYTLGNLTISLLNVIVARGVLPSTEAGKQLFIRRLELVPELLISYNAQVSSGPASTLHALRQTLNTALRCLLPWSHTRNRATDILTRLREHFSDG